MKCCGENRNSLFCPDCGKRLTEEDTPEALVLYLRARLRQDVKTSVTWTENSRHHESKKRAHCLRYVECAERRVAKWSAWLAWLDEKIQS